MILSRTIKITMIAGLLIVLIVSGCTLDQGGNSVTGSEPPALNEIDFWAYQIQGIDEDGAVDALRNSTYDMLVIEPTRTDTGSSDFDTAAAVTSLKNSKTHDGVHRKLVIAYVDIGEAEDWRWYWTWSKESEDDQIDASVPLPEDWPDYILARDPDGWTGNYPVAYWNPQWKDIVIHGLNTTGDPSRNYTSAVDELIKDGFDGIYLDWVEGFENDEVIAAATDAGLDAAQEMVDFICEIRSYARNLNPDFLVIQQNAAALLALQPELPDCIDAIAQEGVWYDGVAGDDWNDTEGYFENDAALTNEYITSLDSHVSAGIPVFVCEYALDGDNAYSNAKNKGYVAYVTRRSLSRLTDTPPPGM